jgi:membrane protein DedA with SNARE-associated domain
MESLRAVSDLSGCTAVFRDTIARRGSMSMHELVIQLSRYGLALVFCNVFLEQIGAPIPALPTLIVAGAFAAHGRMSLVNILLVAVAGSLIADTAWYLLGRRQGRRVLKTLCRISLSPDSCVRSTESLFEKAGMPSLLYAKFIPGYSTVAPPLAGITGRSLGAFLVWDGLGSLLWAGSAAVVGHLFHNTIQRVIENLEALGSWAGALLAAGLAAVVAVKWNERRKSRKLLDLARITVAELQRSLLEDQPPPLVVDVRSRAGHTYDPRRIPGALRMALDELDEKIGELPRDRDIILYCT